MSSLGTVGNFERLRALHATPRFVVTAGVRANASTELRVLDHAANRLVATVAMPCAVHALAGDDVVVAAGCADGWVRVVELASGKITSEHHLHEGPVFAVAMRQGAVMSGGADGVLQYVDVKSGDGKKRSMSTRAIRAVAFDDKGDVVFCGGDDGVVRMLGVGGPNVGVLREMAGHDGPVLALAYLPREGRVASGGDDGTIRLWYLSGDVEHEVKGNDADAHKGAVTALVHVAGEAVPGAEPTDRLYSTSVDGTMKAWRLEDRKKPRTLTISQATDGTAALHAIAFVSSTKADEAARGAGTLFFGGESRTLSRTTIAAGGQLADAFASWKHGFEEQSDELTGARPKREAAVTTLFGLGEREARDLLARAMSSDKEADVRVVVVKRAKDALRHDLRDAVRAALDDADKAVRAAAFDAILALDSDVSSTASSTRGPITAMRAALSSKHADIRRRALEKLVTLAGTSPLVPGLVADRLKDSDSSVRLAALSAVVALDLVEKKDPPVDALVAAFEKGAADVRAWVLVRAARGGLLGHPALAAVMSRSLDDDDADVRATSFALRVLVRKPLAEKIEGAAALKGTDLTSSFKQALKRVSALENGDPALAAAATDEDAGIARMVLPPIQGEASSTDAELEPLLVAMACRTPDTALRGALSLAVLGDARALGALLQLSRETDAGLRRGTVPGLQAIGDERAKKRLAWMLDDVDAQVRAAAYDALLALEGASGALALADIALRASHEDVRARGLALLVKAGKDAPGAALLLEEAIEDESARVRAEAFRTLWSWHQASPQTAIERALDARFPDTRTRAVEELAARAKSADDVWSKTQLVAACGDVDGNVGKAAFDAAQKVIGEKDAAPVLAALESPSSSVRALAAKAARKLAITDALRSALTKLLLDDDVNVRTNALESLDVLVTTDNGPLITGLQSKHLDLRVRAAELLALRKDEQLIDTMRALVDDKDLVRVVGPEAAMLLRRRAIGALATLGSRKNVRYLSQLIRDTSAPIADANVVAQNVGVREEAARGLASSSRAGDEATLLDAMGHSEIWVRSWAAEGLARLGDMRALPVLTGTLRHEHLPIRRGAILGFAAFGPDGYSGMLQGLEDPDDEIEQIVFAIVLAHDLQLLRKGRAPDFLATALSSQRAEIRFAAARALEMRVDAKQFGEHLVEVLMPAKPEKASDITPDKGWPVDVERNRVVRALVDALGSDAPERRYAAAQALLHRKNPRDFFKVAADVAKPRPASAAVVPDTRPRPISLEGDAVSSSPRIKRGTFRKLFAKDAATEAKPSGNVLAIGAAVDTDGEVVVAPAEKDRLRRLAFGAYVGLLRQVVAGDESQRVRRDAVDRIVDLGKNGGIGVAASIPPLVRALDDGHHLVRRAALAGLKELVGVDEARRLGLGSPHADVARAVLDELFEIGAPAKAEVARGLSSSNAEVRKVAFELLQKLAAHAAEQAATETAKSALLLEPAMLALASPHADLRLGVVELLASSNDARVISALERALSSDHDDLRLRAAELLARPSTRTSKENVFAARAADVLGAFLRHDNATLANRARGSLSSMKHPAAVAALSSRLDEVTSDAPAIHALVDAIARCGAVVRDVSKSIETSAIDVATASLAALVSLFDHDVPDVRLAAFDACLVVVGAQKRHRAAKLELQFLAPAVRAKDALVRKRAAEELDRTDDNAADALLTALFLDRDPEVRTAAVASYAARVRRRNADPTPLVDVLKKGRRELVLPAGEGLASLHQGTAHDSAVLVSLLLVARAGEPGERERALTALGSLGDPRALAELETIANGGTSEAPAEPSMRVAATEALGRLHNAISDADARSRIWQLLDSAAGENSNPPLVQAALRGLIAVDDARSRARLDAALSETSLDKDTVLLAANGLRLIGDASNEAALAQALLSPYVDVALSAKRALERILPNDAVKIALYAVGSNLPTIAGPAATFLAEEGEPADLLKRLPELKNDELRERIRFGLLRRQALPADALTALLEDDRTRARANGAFLAGARAARFDDAARTRVLSSLLVGEEKCASGHTHATQQEKLNELTTWLRFWVAARRMTASSGTNAPATSSPAANVLIGTLRDLAKRRIQAGAAVPATIRAAAVRFLSTTAHVDDTTAVTNALGDADGNVRQAAAFALKAAFASVASKQTAIDDPIARAVLVDGDKNARNELAANKSSRPAALPGLWRDRDAAALLDAAREGDRGAVDALSYVDDDIARAALFEMAGDDELDEEMRKAAYRALRRNHRRQAAAEKKRTSPFAFGVVEGGAE